MGIGGFFFRSKDPKGLGEWCEQHLGITLASTRMGAKVWEQEAGQTVFDPFPETSKYFGDPAKVWMLNFRVRDLDKMAAQLQAAAIAIKVDSQTYPNGRFARLHDPEGILLSCGSRKYRALLARCWVLAARILCAGDC